MEKLTVRAKLVELYQRIVRVSPDKREASVYYNGEGNLYPNEIERVINNSPIASRSAKIFAKYISGAGVLVGGNIVKREDLPVVNKKQNLTIADIFEMGGRSIAYQGGVFLWRGFGIDVDGDGGIVPKSIEVLDYKKCRISKEDGDENPGKIWFRNWEKKEDKDNKAQWFYPFSNDMNVIKSQIARDYKDKRGEKLDFGNIEQLADAIACSRGQVLFVNLTPEYIYPLSPFDSVFNDCDTDFRISLYNNSNTRNGYLGKTIIVTQGLDEEQEKDFSDDVQSWLGAENAGNAFVYNVENRVDSLDEVIKTIEIKPTFYDKMFTDTDARNRRNILGCANNLPSQLLYATDGALFSSGSDTILEYKKFYSEQTEDERSALVRAVKQMGFDYDILPIGSPVPNTTIENANQ